MEFYGIDKETYYRTFGSTYLAADTDNTALRTFTLVSMILGFFALVTCLSAIMTYRARVSRLIKELDKNGTLDEVAEELGNSPLTDTDPTFTDNYLFNRRTVTAVRISDIVMVSPVNTAFQHFLAAYLNQGNYAVIAGKDKGDYEDIINMIRETVPDLLINNTVANYERYSEIVKKHLNENNEHML